MARRLFHLLILLLVIGGAGVGLWLLSEGGLDYLRGRARYRVPLAELAVTPPLGMTRQEFIDEVQYLARLPEFLDVLEDNVAEDVAKAFSRHPWVQKVGEVRITPPRTIQVLLRYRQPVLAVPWEGTLRSVDAQGILLPRRADTKGLPVFQGKVPPPTGPAGQPWGDPAIEAQARSLESAGK